MSDQVTGTLGIELGADNAIRDVGVLRQSFTQLVTAEDAVVAASKAMTEVFKAQAAAARADAAQARAQETARKEAANASKASANASAKAAADEARATKESQNALAEKVRAEEQSAKAAAQAVAAEKRATDALEQRTRSMALQELEAHKLNAAFDKNVQAGTGVIGMYNKLGAAAAAYKVLQYVREGIALADSYTNIESKLGLVSNGTAGLTKTTNALFDISQDTRTELGANVSLYTSLYRSTRTLGTSQEDLLKVNKAVAQSFLINGAATSESEAATRQLGQALASGVLRGDEFNSIAENAPRIQQAVAESLGVTTGELREMAAQGKLTGAVVVKAMVDAAQAIDGEASKIAPTYATASKQAGNAILLLVGRINEAAGFTRSLAGEVQSFADIAGKLAKDQELVNYWTEVGRGFRTGNAAFEDTEEGLVALATVGLRSVQFGTALATKDFTEFETRTNALKKAIDALNNSYGDTGKVLAKPVQISVLGFSDFGSNPRPLAKPAAAKATQEEIDALKKRNEEYAKAFAAGSREFDKQVELNAAYVKGARALEDINDAYELKTKLAGIDEKLSNTQKARLTELVVGTHSQTEAIKEQKRAEEDAQAAFDIAGVVLKAHVIELVKLTPLQQSEVKSTDAATESWKKYYEARAGKKVVSGVNVIPPDAQDLIGNKHWAEYASDTLSVVEEISASLDKAGSKFARTIAGAARGLGNIANASSSASSATTAVGTFGGVAGLGVAIYGFVSGFAKQQHEMADEVRATAIALRELRVAAQASLANYKLQAFGSDLDQTLFALKQQYNENYSQLIQAGGVDPNAPGRAAHNIVPTAQDFIDAAAAYDKLVQGAKEAAAKAAAEVIAATAKAVADETKRFDRSLFDIKSETRAYTDPRGAAEAAFFENWKRRIDDATTSEEKLALESDKAASAMNFFAERAFKDATETRGYLARIFGANGNTRGAEDATRLSNQLEERRNNLGSTPLNQLLSDRAQYLENSAILRDRNIEDGAKKLTDAASAKLKDIDKLLADEKAIADKRIADLAGYAADEKELNAAFNRAKDDEIKVIEDSAKVRLDNLAREAEYARANEQATQKQLTLIQQEVDARRQAVDSLKAYSDSLKLSDLSTLSPVDKVGEARKQFDALSRKAQGGDAASVQLALSAANELLQQKRNTDASGVGYAAEFERVQSIVGALKAQYGDGLAKSESALGKAQTAAEAATQNIAAIEAERTAITDATTKQVDAINLLREDGNAASAKLLESWQKESDAVSQKYSDFTDAQNKAKDAITQKLTESIDTLKANEQAAYDERAKLTTWREDLYKQQESATQFLSDIASALSADSVRSGWLVNQTPVPMVSASQPAPATQGESQLIAEVQSLKAVVNELKTQLALVVGNTGATASAVAAQSGALARAGSQISEAIGDGATQIRQKLDRSPANS